jgi:hypothetical protein
MEMDDVEFIQYIDDMIAVLEDGKELLNRPESIAAVAMLNEVLTFNSFSYQRYKVIFFLKLQMN